MSSTTARRPGFRADIQGLRAVAVGAVLLYHAGVPLFSGGFIGVDAFFVISGFLITTHLMKALDRGSLRFADFWARRVRRLLPASWTVAAITTISGALYFAPQYVPTMLKQAAATFAYVPNILFAEEGTDYLANPTPSAFQHYWSLGVEEQFYLVWPLVLFLIYKASRGRKRGVMVVTAVLTVLSFVAGWWLTGVRQPWAFFLLPARAWEMGVGGLMAMALLAWPGLNKTARWKKPLAWGGLLAATIPIFLYNDDTFFPGWVAGVPVLGIAAVILGGTGYVTGGTVSLLSLRPLVWLGKVSYSVYLVHWPLLVVPQTAIGWENPLPLWVKLILVSLALPLGWASWRFIEEPFRKGLILGTKPHRSLIVAVTGATVLAFTVLSLADWYKDRPLHTYRTAPATVLTKNPEGTPYVPSNISPTLREATSDTLGECHAGTDEVEAADCRYGDNQEAPLVALWGDSHANTWFPALLELAQEGKIRVDKYTKTSCTAADVIPTFLSSGERYLECERWREAVLERLQESPPDVVVLASFSNGVEPNEGQAYESAVERTIDAIPESAKVVLVEDVPLFYDDPLACLARNLRKAYKCEIRAEESFNEEGRAADRGAAERTRAIYMEVSPYLCGETCPLIQGNTLVYRDNHHLTSSFSRLMAPVFEPYLTP